MTLDPNWFYSSLAQCAAAVVGLAQCAAAVVGLLGAVVATRLQQQLATVKEVRLSFDPFRVGLRQAVAEHRIHVGNYEAELDTMIARAEQSIRNGGRPPLVVNIRKTFPRLGGGTVFTESKNPSVELIASEKARREKVRRLRELFDRVLQEREPDKLPSFAEELQRLAADAGDDAGPILSDYPARMRSLMEAGRAVRAAASREVAVVLLVILTVLCVVGVIAPIAFLSATDATSKYGLLAAFAAALLGLPCYITYQIFELRKAGDVSLVS